MVFLGKTLTLSIVSSTPLPTHTPNAQLYQNKTNHRLKPTDGFNKKLILFYKRG